ncbi:MAG: hypothetical protein CFH10_01191 [Alphaproteobacteria bacterium MarineAlpha4_Bin2]|nr:MAG: hypothetical protein CFH10_01191 [Alphaproteobacteria bacterium MarineAlpha4_Bin2]
MRRKLPDKEEESLTPTRMQELVEIESLLIRSYRRWIAGMRLNDERYWSVVWVELSGALGNQSARTILGGLQSLIVGIGNNSRRSLRIYPPCCGFICTDELLILTLISAHQQRHHSRARSTAEWIVSTNGISVLLAGSRRIADTLTAREIILPNRIRQRIDVFNSSANVDTDSKAVRPQLRVVDGGCALAGGA